MNKPEKGPVRLGNEKLIRIYSTMVRIRSFEDECQKQFTAGKIHGMLHICSGEEAIFAGACETLREDDYIVGTHRNHGLLLARGADPRYMMAEMFGKKSGYNKGKGGDMHITPHGLGIVCCSAIVGSGIPIAVGVALASKMRGKDCVTACFFGDGATNQGTFHESLNLASVYDLPITFIIVNSQFGVSTPITRTAKVKKLSKRAVSYSIPGITVDGNNVLKVLEVVREAVSRARSKGGPTLIECVSYNQQNPKKYDVEIRDWERIWGDPIDRFEKKLFRRNVLTSNQAEEIKRGAVEEMEQAVRFAEESLWPDIEETSKDVFA
jgi:TPP-dependent pyruvate/acetoin dehydrogenase alpha subunit